MGELKRRLGGGRAMVVAGIVLLGAGGMAADDKTEIHKVVDGESVQSCTADTCSFGVICPGETIRLRIHHKDLFSMPSCIAWYVNEQEYQPWAPNYPACLIPALLYERPFTFTDPGTYEITAAGDDLPGPSKILVTVTDPSPEIVDLEVTLDHKWGPPVDGRVCLEQQVCVSAQTSEDGDYTVDFGDGSVATVRPNGGYFFLDHVCHYYEEPGRYPVTVTAVNACGSGTPETFEVSVSTCTPSTQSCCPKNPVVWTSEGHFYALNTAGDLERIYWSGSPGWTSEVVEIWGPPIVRGSLVALDSRHVAAVNEAGQIVVTQAGPPMATEFAILSGGRKTVPCSLVATEEYGLFGVTETGGLQRVYKNGNDWIFDGMQTYGGAIAPGTLVEMEDGRIGGLNEHGVLWNTWWNLGTNKLQFDLIPEGADLLP